MHSKYLILPSLLALFVMQGCSNNASIFSKDNLPLVHRIDIQQGNVIEQNMLAQLKVGMEKKKVLYIMGTPLIKDTFHSDRWDYIYSLKQGRDVREQRRVTLYFKDDKLSHAAGDIQAANGEIQMTSRIMEKVDVPEGDPDNILAKVKNMVTFDDDEPLISDETDVDEQTQAADTATKVTEAVNTSETQLKTDDQTVPELKPEEAADDSESEEGGFFEKNWGDDVDPNDPVLNDPDLNPSY